ncbi:MAG: nitroreductase family protein [Armatimonadota bacterium]
MKLMEAIYARHSVRAYTNEPVSRETLDFLLKIAVQAPTAMNLQPWAFGVIQGAERLRVYSDRTKAYMLENLEKFPGLERYRDFFTDPNSNIFYNAPALIAVFAKPGGVAAENDCTMAAQNIMLAATDMDLGTCWIGFFAFLLGQPEVKRELGVPEDYRIVAPIIVGHPAGPVPPVEKAAPEVIFWKE